MTGSVERIIHSGRAPDLRKASIRRSRLIAFLRRWPEVWRISTWRSWLRVSRSMASMIFLTASAPMPASKSRPCASVIWRYSDSVSVLSTWMSFSFARSVRAHRRASSVSRVTCSRSLAVASSMPEVRSEIGGLELLLRRGAGFLRLLVDGRNLGLDDLAQLA